ncbi:MAG: hypothetical protein QM820_55210 [Minicystis sp.]
MRFLPATLAAFSIAATLPFGPLGCADAPRLRPVVPTQPTELTKCKVGSGKQNPLVTEWPASEKANLEGRLREGAVVVAYSGCTMRLLPACRPKGSYTWRRTTTSTDTVEVNDVDELYAKLPLGAATLEGELGRSGRIAVTTTISGQLSLTGLSPEEVPEGGSCAGATHVIGALSVGAFKLKSGGAVHAKADVGFKGVGVTGSTKSEETLIRDAGDPEACRKSTDQSPDIQCGSPIQVFLQPLPSLTSKLGPAGTVRVRFVSSEGEQRWQVLANDSVLCTTPCDRWVDPATALAMRADDGFLKFLQKNAVTVPDLRAHPPGSSVEVRAQPASFGRYSGGVVMTTFGSLGVAAGIALLGAGCSNTSERGGICAGGGITLPLSAALLVPGIVLLAGSGARAEISIPRDIGAARGTSPRVLAGPGFVMGSF